MDFAYPRSVTRTAADAIAWREKEAARARPPSAISSSTKLIAEPLGNFEVQSVAPEEPESRLTLGVKIAAASVGAAFVTLSVAILQIA